MHCSFNWTTRWGLFADQIFVLLSLRQTCSSTSWSDAFLSLTSGFTWTITVLIMVQQNMFILLFGFIWNVIPLDFQSCLQSSTGGKRSGKGIGVSGAVREKEFYFQEVWLYWLVFNLKCVPQLVNFSRQWHPVGFEVAFKESRGFILILCLFSSGFQSPYSPLDRAGASHEPPNYMEVHY